MAAGIAVGGQGKEESSTQPTQNDACLHQSVIIAKCTVWCNVLCPVLQSSHATANVRLQLLF